MSNNIKVKRGAEKPTTSNLEEYELGYSTNNKKLYIRDANDIVDISEKELIEATLSKTMIYTSDWKTIPINNDSDTNINIWIAEDYPYYYNLPCSNSKNSYYPWVNFLYGSNLESGSNVSIKVFAHDGYLYFYASDLPEKDMGIYKCLFLKG